LKLGDECLEQIKVYEFVKQCTDLPFLHIANERSCSIQQGMILKRMGVRAGVSDIFIPRANKTLHGLWIELKFGKNKLSSSQLKFINEMIAEGYGAFVAYGAEEAILVIKSFYNIE
jgi:hypothetical protein